jgi:DNA modification methylase
MGKTLDDADHSRDKRKEILQLFGGELPESILRYNTADRSRDLLVEEQGRAYTDTGYSKNSKDESKSVAEERAKRDKNFDLFMLSGAGARWGGLSRFPQNVGRILLKLYTKRGMTVVDPFAGHNSRMELCWRLGRNYIGCDLSKKFMKANFELRDLLFAENKEQMLDINKATIELHECDSQHMPVKNNAGDFTITSPPYWCLEDYGDEMQQLGKNDYPTFLQKLGQVMRENFRCLRSGSFAVWCVNDFRYDGKFYNYHGDTIRLMRDAGFKQWDIAITDLGTSMRASFATQVLSQKILPKRHEYALIFVKP